LEYSQANSQSFYSFVFPIMPSVVSAFEVVISQQFKNLRIVTGCQKKLVSTPCQFLDDRHKEWDMWGIIEIDPNLMFVATVQNCYGRLWSLWMGSFQYWSVNARQILRTHSGNPFADLWLKKGQTG
jgi:hypothetical protein